MPYLNIKLSAVPSEELSRDVASTLTRLTAEILKKKAELTAVTIEYVKPAFWFIAGAPIVELQKTSAYVEIQVTKGTNTKDEKSLYLARVFAALEEMLGPLHPASYVVIHEVDADAWGYQGRTQEFRVIAGRLS